ncbi:Nucleolar protein 9 [Ceratobasidium sp. 394]|nr:Nucleolar protein 9 [Ceratobasidium sp. 394]KAG9101829.1 Nucleolar protein 9 [Ceratobasidium sp. UAMH 11750]
MPRENRKRGKKKKGNNEQPGQAVQDAQPEVDPEQAQPTWMQTNDEPNLDAPFGYVDPDVKAYFRTVDSKIQEWQSQGYAQGRDEEEGNTHEDKRMFLVAALSESSGKEKQLATDPDCAIIIERMLHSMDDFVKRIFADRLCGSYAQLAQHRFGSHVCQTLFEVSTSTVSRETRGRIARAPDAETEVGVLRTMTELVLAVCEEILPSLPQLILNPFAAHVVLSLLLLLSPTIAQPVDSAKPHTSLVRSKKSAAYKSRQGSMKSVLEPGTEHDTTAVVPPSFGEMAGRFVDTLKGALDANEVRALAADKVANPVLQAIIELEAKQNKSDSPGSLMDSVLMGAISALHHDNQPEHSDYIETLLRDPTASHLFETLVQHTPEPSFQMLWNLYFKNKLAKLSSHPVANFVVGKAILRLDAEILLEAIQEVDGVAGKLVKTARTGVLKSLVDRAAALQAHQDVISGCISQAVGIDDTQVQHLVPCLLTLKTVKLYMKGTSLEGGREAENDSNSAAADSVEPTVQGAVLVQSMIRLSEPHNQAIVRSIQAQGVEKLIAMSRNPISSRVLDVFLESPAVQTRDKRNFLLGLMGHYHTLVDDRIGSRVGDRCWQCADPYLKERIAKSILPHEDALAASYYGKYFARNLHLTMLKRDPAAWRDMQRNQKAAATKSASTEATGTSAIVNAVPSQDDTVERAKKRKRAAIDLDEIDLLFSNAHSGGMSASKQIFPTHGMPGVPPPEKRIVDAELGEVLGAIKKVSRKEGLRKSKRS